METESPGFHFLFYLSITQFPGIHVIMGGVKCG